MRLPWARGAGEGHAGIVAAMAPDEPVFDEELLSHIRRLAIHPGRVRGTGIAGEHRSRRRGSSPEFADFKPYSQGDDFRRIDWNTYARLDGLFVRLSEVTTELDVHLLVDASDSMQWRSGDGVPSKFTYARRVAGALGYVALWHFDRLAVTPFGDRLGEPFGPAQGRSQAPAMLMALERMAPLGGTALAGAVERYLFAHRRPGVLVIVSDLLAGEPEDLRHALRAARSRGWQAAVVQVLDEAEVAPAAAEAFLRGDAGDDEAVELVDAENGQRLTLSPESGLLERYGDAVTTWLDAIDEAIDEEHAACVRLLTSWDFTDVALRLLRERGVLA